MHAHAWDFVDQPLVYQAMFGGQFKQNGLQVKWLAPTDLFLEFGAETGNGDGFPATRLESNGFNGATLFAHVGGDIGDDSSWRAGAAWLTQQAENRAGGIEDASGGDRCSIRSPATARPGWSMACSSGRPRRAASSRCRANTCAAAKSGDIFDAGGPAAPTTTATTQSGWYLQGVYQFATRWRVGARYDSLDSGMRSYAVVPDDLLDASPDRVSLMLDWNPSEFSRLRAQYDWDNARDDGDDGSHLPPAVHLRTRRAWRSQVLGIRP